MKIIVLPTLALLAVGGAALAQNVPPRGGDRQMQSAEERFKQLDANGDGKVTLDEYKAMRGGMRAGAGGPPAGGPRAGAGGPPAGGPPPGGNAQGDRRGEMQATREERFKAADTNKDGSLSLAEYKAMPRGQGGLRRSGDGK